MQKTLFICTILFIVLCAGNCKKPGEPDNTPAGDYQPLTVGSEWNYTVTGSNAGSYKITILNRDTTINGKVYSVASNSASSNEYYAKFSGEYLRYNKFAELNNQTIELLYLKDKLAKGATWTEVKTVNVTLGGTSVPVTATLVFTIADKGIDYVVNGVTFKNVIKVTVTPSFSIFGSTQNPDSHDLQYYYAFNVGLVYSKTSIVMALAGINHNSETKIGTYTIK
ncbi:hypothetical protein ESA94_09560 [Lacibacter luteus]|uniref:Uncharacterized protein n=1 Tax=Lacibacter luteus TaxID=2508719 RepID=A0A4Q1CJC2_9BACT|nr:hypothetical protein [Lacibacter luteus]RXK60699.1 hypothetical protein ESA94_09560 [Lacibacter luteus]